MERAMHPTHFQPGEGKSYRLGRMTMTFKTTSAEGWNAYTVCEAIEPPDSGAGYHRHATYDETFVICEGHYDFRLDGKLLKLGPGDVVFVPRGTPHGFLSTGPEVGRQLIISSPGGVFDALIAEVSALDTGSPTRQASQEAKDIAPRNTALSSWLPDLGAARPRHGVHAGGSMQSTPDLRLTPSMRPCA